MPKTYRLIFGALFCFAIVIGIQFRLAHQISNMIRYLRAQEAIDLAVTRSDIASARNEVSSTQTAIASQTKQLAALREAAEGLTDQLNSIGRDSFDPQRHASDLLRQMRQIGRPFIVVIGDSITQRAPLPASFCGYPIINAGIGGSRASNFVPFAEEMASLKPALVVVALGVNDALNYYNTSFEESYSLLIDSLPKVPMVVASLAPIDFTGSDGRTIDPDKAKSVDRSIRSIASKRNIPLVDLGKLFPIQTLDGVHLTVNAYQAWNAAVLDGARSSLNCPE